MIRADDIFKFLCDKYPLDTACDFDNAGFLVGDRNTEVKNVTVSLDCTVDTVNFAKSNGSNLIITHHPVIWDGLKSLNEDSVVYQLIRCGICVISMHTNMDIAKGGVNDRLCECLGLSDITEYIADDGFAIRRASTDISNPDELALHIKQCLNTSVRYVKAEKSIKNLLVCCGSGGEFVLDAVKGGFDALITADVKHNQFIDAINCGISLFDAGHYATENICIKPLCNILSAAFPDVHFEVFDQSNILFI